jgi:hypothetical protein
MCMTDFEEIAFLAGCRGARILFADRFAVVASRIDERLRTLVDAQTCAPEPASVRAGDPGRRTDTPRGPDHPDPSQVLHAAALVGAVSLCSARSSSTRPPQASRLDGEYTAVIGDTRMLSGACVTTVTGG